MIPVRTLLAEALWWLSLKLEAWSERIRPAVPLYPALDDGMDLTIAIATHEYNAILVEHLGEAFRRDLDKATDRVLQGLEATTSTDAVSPIPFGETLRKSWENKP